MTCASDARVITGINQANLIHLSIKMTTLHQSGALFVGERVFQNEGVCEQVFSSFPSPIPFLPPFCSRPIFRASRMWYTNTHGPNFGRFVREHLLCRLVLSSLWWFISMCSGQLPQFLPSCNLTWLIAWGTILFWCKKKMYFNQIQKFEIVVYLCSMVLKLTDNVH